MAGVPSADDVASVKSAFAPTMVESLQGSAFMPLNSMYPDASPEALDMLARLLTFNPKLRCAALLSASLLLQWSWVSIWS